MSEKLSRISVLALQVFRFAGIALLMLAIAFLYRLIFLLTYADWSGLQGYWGDILFSFFQGARFDILVIMFLLVPLLGFAFLSAIVWRKFFEQASKIWACIAAILFAALLLGDFYYYRFFGSHYSMQVFGIVDDETSAVLKSIWLDFPVIRIALFLIVLSFLICYCIRKIYRSTCLLKQAQKKWGRFLFVIIILLSVFFIRGRLGMFPLRLEDGFISNNQFVNTLTQNPIFTFKAVYVDYKKNKLNVDVNKMLRESGFSSDKELVSQYVNLPVDSIINDPLVYLQKHTPVDTFLINNPPHVVVLQMEGMGVNFMDLQSPDFQILGSLANELPHCITFNNFLPFFEGTIFSLEGLLTGSVITPISLTPYNNQCNLASVVTPFHKAGYTATFVTGAKKAWRNLDVFLPAQGFDNYDSRENIMHDIPEAIEEEWGVYDGFMFQQIWNRLEKATSPQFVFGMSITNHTPYTLPPNYAVSAMEMSPDLKGRLQQNEKVCYECFSTYRYACDCIADFIHKVRESPLKDRVIVVVTGDHSVKGIVKNADNDILKRHGVPLIMYVPERYLTNKTVDTKRWGSHKDIFPTVFNLALSGANYYHLGNDMLSSQNTYNFAADIPIAAMNNAGAMSASNKQLYEWSNDNTSLVSVEKAKPALDSLQQQFRLWLAVSKYVTMRSFENKNKENK